MTTGTLFAWTFPLATPFWALMILAPSWRWTARVMASPWVPLLPLVCYFALAVPHFGALWEAVSRPDLEVLRTFAGTPHGAALFWAQLIAFDLFIGRWMYFQAREHGIHPLITSPILLLTIFLSPIGLVAFLAVRSTRIRATESSTARDRR